MKAYLLQLDQHWYDVKLTLAVPIQN